MSASRTIEPPPYLPLGHGRVLLGFLLAPVAWFLLCGLATGGVGLLLLIALPVVWTSAFLLGFPILLLCRRHGWLDWWQAMAGGCLTATPLSVLVSLGGNLRSGIVSIVFWLCHGAEMGFIFWLLVRPDRRTPGGVQTPSSTGPSARAVAMLAGFGIPVLLMVGLLASSLSGRPML